MRVLVLGATGGLGSALAHLLREHTLFLSGRRSLPLRELAEALGGTPLPGDLTDAIEAKALLEEAGPLDLLLHAVGVAGRAPVRETSRELLEGMLSAHLLTAHHALRYARLQQGGRAVFFGAYPTYVRVPGFAAYAAAKGALEAYLEAARKELRREGVHLILVRLPAVATGLWAPLGGPPKGALPPEEAARKVLEGVLAEPPPEVLEV
ncbi:MAG: SDR family NAD(P)-dependent oxidoreductase [Meiothermus sp.]|uniref:SDR family NAD(P)-dependent oxidoreductase n=1 Tax=Meiothermus sp. TaxID=1955249 RepID=UPI0025D1E229|nr:SDR family NAD(P)-dependent oxidoreductase [Meiothermus sp.]MCS7058363.1 SDR family NAD(P)-dependent oxidoreductase [Meiothermus sp.]MCS7194944.1 SDR family NAD(P)-dependent oxidoreductase [Meiothermus sp.]MCX7740693.1 SDR family NAD(P)-dependent oxidoreductase [Meiothermus sp.]MDW8090660.1 SDR family NAD(P)-dependent oxidoreductase [Meiothermus sp.]MDW8482584.1 SDR family NAD(P)-dependent oxidoreductase [Meiothermus sp.]